MATLKIKLRPSSVEGKEGTLFYQVIHNRAVRLLKSPYRVFPHEWDSNLMEVILPDTNNERYPYLSYAAENLMESIRRFGKITVSLEKSKETYTADEVMDFFSGRRMDKLLFPFAADVIENMRLLGKVRISETYAASLSSFRRFRRNRDISLDELDSDIIMAYEAYLRGKGLSPNSSSFYMRNLRAVYNRAVEKNLTQQQNPFKHVYTGVDKTVKRAVTLKVMKQIKEIDCSGSRAQSFARDMFLFSFYTRGMSFVDMAYLKKRDLKGGILTYRRSKTRQRLFVKWDKCMQEIVDKYNIPQSEYLLPLIKPFRSMDERTQYIYASHNINRGLKLIGAKLGLPVPLTMYVSRHAWASIAKSKNIPLSVISEGMGHDSEATTRIYLASLDTAAIDKANSMILKSL